VEVKNYGYQISNFTMEHIGGAWGHQPHSMPICTCMYDCMSGLLSNGVHFGMWGYAWDWESIRVEIKSPYTNYRGCQIQAGATLPGSFWTRPKTTSCPAQLRKKHCPCILEGRLITNPILSALHLQGLKPHIYIYIYIYMHFHLVNKPLIGISFRKWNHQWRT
jgi:hypothetical protein